MESAILFGNGFNLLAEKSLSWNKLLEELSVDDGFPILKDISPTLQYEQLYLSSDKSQFEGDSNDERNLKLSVKNKLVKMCSNVFYERLTNMPVDIFLTTNYDHALFNALFNNEKNAVIASNNSEKLYSIRRWKKIRINDRERILFPIHGDISVIKSIMLGLDHYGGALAKIEDYVKGNYGITSRKNGKEFKYPLVPSISKRLKDNNILCHQEYGFKDSGFSLLSWIDAFFFYDLYIIGLSLDFAEIDLWWLISRRARMMRSGRIKNKIVFLPTSPLSEIHLHLSKIRLLEQMGVKIIHHSYNEDIVSGITDYRAIYNQQLDKLENLLK